MNTLQQLQDIMPGQPIAWYKRIAAEIDAGRMPMPHLTPQETENTSEQPILPEVEVTQPAVIESLVESEEIQPEPSPPPAVETANSTTVYSWTKEELSNPADDVKPPKEVVLPKKQKESTDQQKKAPKASQQKAKKQPPTPSKPPASPILYAPRFVSKPLKPYLLTLCRNDDRLATRLVNHQLELHPEKDFKWAQEKVIWDLERDRR